MAQTWIYCATLLLSLGFAESLTLTSNAMEEICDNALDDDGDGLVDINDPDCICAIADLESIIPNPSFEDFSCCPNTDSQMSCVDGWNQASGGTVDYVNTCDYLVAAERMLPFPDGEGAIIFLTGTINNGLGTELYREYAGTCLNRPLQKDSIYKFKFNLGFLENEFSPTLPLTFFGSTSCDNLPFSVSSDCPTNNPEWFIIKSELVSRNTTELVPGWVEVTTEIQPTTDINALIIGADCVSGSNLDLDIYFLDNLILNDESNFDFELLDQSVSNCDPNFVFEVAEQFFFDYQWYKEGIALIGETDAELSQMYGDGTYQLRITNNNTLQCRIADNYEFEAPVLTGEAAEMICAGESLLFGDVLIDAEGTYENTFTSVEGCDSIVTLNVEIQDTKSDTVYVKKLADATYTIGNSSFTDEGEYFVNLASNNSCDSIVLLFLENLNVYIPNAFSPNNDGFNDYFEVFTSDDDFVVKEISIFDRWGSLVFRGDKWDGRYDNQKIVPGVYVYVLRLMDTTGEKFVVRKDITLVK